MEKHPSNLIIKELYQNKVKLSQNIINDVSNDKPIDIENILISDTDDILS